ncbi:MAG TPA: phosphatase PAP2 family protein [Caulobacteraceae bacterium]
MRAAWLAGGALALALAFAAAAGAAPTGGFLDDHDLNIVTWVPPTPVADGPVEVADLTTYFGTRALVSQARGAEAHLDDVYIPPEVAPRFKDALGIALDPANADAKFILDTIQLAQLDLEALVKPVKQPVKPDGTGGRIRPYVRFPLLPACDHAVDDSQYHLNTSGSYPSTHAGVGMLWALLMSQLASDRTDALFAKGYAFGESRLVCGFHYPSDLAAGRLAATVLVARLQTNKAFQDRMAAAKLKLDGLRGAAPPKPTPYMEKVLKLETQRVLRPLTPSEQ